MYSDSFVVSLIEGSNYISPLTTVNKEECKYSCTTATMEALFVSLSTGVTVSKPYLTSALPAEIFLELRYTERVVAAVVDSASRQITGSKVEVDKKYYVRVMSEGVLFDEAIEWGSEEVGELVPEEVVRVVEYVIRAKASSEQEALEYMEEKVEISKYSYNLVQQGGKLVDLSKGVCEYTGQLCSNLWLNLSDGFIGGGRILSTSFTTPLTTTDTTLTTTDSTTTVVVEGTEGSRKHYEAMKQLKKEYPLVVKLNTLSATTAEVYSYVEDAMVEDANLDRHLSHWGIDRSQLQKTGKSLAEIEFELNKDFAFEKILGNEKNAEVVNDLVGLKNLGNTCYINALLQVIGRLHEFNMFWHTTGGSIGRGNDEDIKKRIDLNSETREWVKILEGLNDLKYVGKNISPCTFRKIFCGTHVDFKTHQQQDVAEFLQFIAEKCPMRDLFKIQMATDLAVAGKGKRELVDDFLLSIQVPRDGTPVGDEVADAAVEGTEVKKARIEKGVSWEECVSLTFGESEINDFRYQGAVTTAVSRSGILTFPKYLFVAVRRYYFDEKWQAQKMDVAVKMPAMMDLGEYRASVSLDLPPLEEDVAPEVASLVEMGFPAELAAKALKKAGGSVEAAMDLLFSGAVLPDEFAGPVATGGSSKYRLVGFVSHLGKSVGTGHYVAHWQRSDGQWVLFNDEHVTKCQEPPVDFGYLYLYQQID